MVGHRGLKNLGPSTFEDFRTAGGEDGLPWRLKKPRPAVFEDLEAPEAMTVGHRGLKTGSLNFQEFVPPEATTVSIGG